MCKPPRSSPATQLSASKHVQPHLPILSLDGHLRQRLRGCPYVGVQLLPGVLQLSAVQAAPEQANLQRQYTLV